MKRIFVIDWTLLPLFAATFATGIGLHVAGDGPHEIWHNRAVAHSLCALCFLIAIIMHVQSHWGWYRSWFSTGLGKKSRVTALLTLLWLFIVITGIILIPVEGADTGLGRWHYIVGLVATGFTIGHIIKRWPILRRSLNRKPK